MRRTSYNSKVSAQHRDGENISKSIYFRKLIQPGKLSPYYINSLNQSDSKTSASSRCCVEALQLYKFYLALPVSVNRFLAARCLTADYLTRCHHRIYHLEHKQMFTGFKIFRYFVFKMVYVKNFLAGKIQGGTPLKFLSKKCSGETLCKFFPIFPPKVLVYIGQIF